ncbi:MAG: hypothetical protein LUM44_17585 [Pyrinomonadaceae bacterium]|nr:hypothetical protein [Pyrinomonadaceae bacterium]
MPRPTTPEFEELLPACETLSTVEMVLRDDTVHRFAPVPLVLSGNTYQPLLIRTGDLKESGGASTNRVSVEISNIDRAWSVLLASSLRKLELADVQIKRLYREIGNPTTFFHKHFFGGKLVGAESSETSLTFDVIPKTTASGVCLATQTLSPTCAWVFKDPLTCKYTGTETTCNLQLKSKAGCRGRNNTEHNGGFTFPDNPTQSSPGSGGNPGTGIGTGSCFLKGTLVFTPRGEIGIEKIKKGFQVYSFNPQTREIEIDTVKEVFKHFVTGYYSLLFEDGFAHVTYEHPFLSESGEFVRVDEMVCGDKFRRFTSGRWKLVKLRKKRWNSGIVTEVYNFHVERNQNYFANRFAVHNTKQPEILV